MGERTGKKTAEGWPPPYKPQETSQACWRVAQIHANGLRAGVAQPS